MRSPLYISDLDGTLLHPNGDLSANSRTGLNQLIEQPDFHFTIATGRGYYSTRQKLEGLNIELPIIVSNGACITDLQTGQHLLINSIPASLIAELYELIRAHHCQPLISSNDGQQDHLYAHANTNEGIRWFQEECAQVKDSRLRSPKLYERGLTETVTSLTIIEQLPVIEKLHAAIEARYADILSFHYYENAYSRGWYWLEISSKEANKGHAIQQLCELQLFDNQKLTVFGDNTNDLSMMRTARHKIAVENAHLEVKALASQVIGHCENDAVLNFLNDLTS
ncbi:MAG: HAD family hydrolase [Saprospiraceae bacterium]